MGLASLLAGVEVSSRWPSDVPWQFGVLVEQIRVKTLLRPVVGVGGGGALRVVPFLKASLR
jgi:hypothetical protein